MHFPLQTEIKIEKTDFQIDHQTPVLTIGSCFSDNIGNLLESYKFQVLRNPFGVLYNPVSIAQVLRFAMTKKNIEPNDLIQHNNLWHSFHFHGSFSSKNIDETLKKTNATIIECHQFLSQTEFLIVTLGTSWVYEHVNTGTIVSNCHKIQEKAFNRYRLTIDAISKDWISLITQLQNFNPKLKIIFTISPVRHLKDGAHENQLSKSSLLLAVDEIQKKTGTQSTIYFPSYEIIMDELRDYRFYTSDMIHISDVATQYVFEKFKSTFFQAPTIRCMNEIRQIVQASEHRFLTDNTQEIKKFADSFLTKIEEIEKKYPGLNLIDEKKYFKKHSEI